MRLSLALRAGRDCFNFINRKRKSANTDRICVRLVSLGKSQCGLSPEQSTILFEIRLPRILLAAAVGASLAAAGASYQALLRNPLAEPYLLGISNGAAVGTMIALVFIGRA